MAVVSNGLPVDTVLDVEKLSSIISEDDVTFYEYINKNIGQYFKFIAPTIGDDIDNLYLNVFGTTDPSRYGRHLGKADAHQYWTGLFAHHYEVGNEFAISAELVGHDTLMLAFNQLDEQSIEYVFNKKSPNSVTLSSDTNEDVPPSKVCELLEIIFKVFSDNGKREAFLKSPAFSKWCQLKRGLA